MLVYVSLALIVLLTSYVVFFTYQRRQKLTCMTGMMIAMTNSMMVSISIGAILGTFIENKDITIPTVTSVLLGMVVGFSTGRFVSLMASLDGLTAGIMGGMMGSMLGVMLQPKSVDLMIYFIDVIFVLVIFLLLRLIDEESKEEKVEKSVTRKLLAANPIILLVLLIFMSTLFFGKGTLFAINNNRVSAEPNEIKFTPASSKIQEVLVKPSGYTPNNIVIKTGKPTIINFKTEKLGCTGIVRSEELGFNVALKENTNNYVNIKYLKPGTYHYSCGMGMFKSTITVTS